MGVRVGLFRAASPTPSCSAPSTSASRCSTRPRSTASAGPSASWAGALGDRRDEAFVASKIFPVLPLAPVVLQRARGSLRRLGIDALDLYQLHQPNPVVPLTSTMPAFAQLLDEGTRAPRGRLQLLVGTLGGSRGRAGPARALQPGPLQPRGPPAREGPPAVGPGPRPARHRLQPPGPGLAFGALRRAITVPAVSCVPPLRPSIPRTCAGSSRSSTCCARWPRPITPRPRRSRWRG